MRVIQVVPSLAAESSGPSYSVPGLCKGLKSVGVDVELHVPSPVLNPENHTFKIVQYPRKTFFHLRGAEWSPKMKRGLFRECRNADIIHTNALWMIPNVYAAKAVKGTQCKLVTAPRGSLAPWALGFNKIKKCILGRLLGQYSALSATNMWHATCEKEYEEIRMAGYQQPVAIVPIGMDVPDVVSHVKETEERIRKVVFFGRLHKVKAIDNLELAWAQIADRFRGWELVIAGPDGGVRNEMEALVDKERIPRVSFVGEINGDLKYKFLGSADVYVLPSRTENFGVTVAEALACGTPVIASQGTPWKGLEAERAGRWVPIGVESLVMALHEIMSLDDLGRRQMGERGRQWIVRDFSWTGIGTKMKVAYEWLLGKGDKPEWVKLD